VINRNTEDGEKREAREEDDFAGAGGGGVRREEEVEKDCSEISAKLLRRNFCETCRLFSSPAEVSNMT
jgi:hypothetical protein